MKKLLLFFLTFFASGVLLFAQKVETIGSFQGYKQALFVVPQYAAVNGFRVDYERKLHNENWLIFAPQIYLDRESMDFDEYDELTGYGLHVYYKRFLSQSLKLNENGLSRTNIYFSAGPTYQHFNIVNTEQIPETYIEDGVEYVKYNAEEVVTNINKIGANIDFGLQFIFNSFSLDLYSGAGFRFALDENGELMEEYDAGWLSPGYSGIVLTGGVRLGFMLK